MKKIIFTVFILLIPCIVKAECSNTETVRLRALASQINVTYNYEEKDDGVVFTATLHNVNKALKIVDNRTGKEYISNNDFSDIVLDNIKASGTYSVKVLSNQSNCIDKSITTKYYTIPKYNKYYKDQLCVLNKTQKLCQKWVDTSSMTYEQFQKALKSQSQTVQITESEKSNYNKVMDFLVEYYHFFLVGIIAIALLAIYIINKKNNYNFDI